MSMPPEAAGDLGGAPVAARRGSLALSHHAWIVVGRLVLLAVVVAVWEALARNNVVPAAFIGQPSIFLPFLVTKIMDGSFIVGIRETLTATLAAFVIGGIAAILTALVLTASHTVKALVDPFIDAMNALPRVALVPLFIVWFGLGTLSKIVSGISLMYFILLYNTLAGAQSVEPDHIQLARSLGLSKRRIFTSIVVPTAVPSIFAGLRLGLIYTLLGVVTAELIAGGKGLGSLISYYSNTFDANGVFAVLLVLVFLSYVLAAIMTRIERHLTRWQR
ncbi:MAG TPA: ABC transporter permease [Casimicrobiaceae bacterium]|jgi:NitT/TauT family transport system permease protein|nr:ABC transporter permease [Casimicrobiaceae bacterium]